MPPTPIIAQNDEALLTRLRDAGVQFVIIGGVCGVYYGVPITTYDLDVCCPFTEENLMKIQSALADLQPYHRLTPQKVPFELNPELCSRLKNLYLQTSCGKLDCLGEVAGIGGYNEVLANSTTGRFPYGEFKLLTLDALILAKNAVGRDRDLRAAAHLQAIRERLGKKDHS